MPEKCCHKLLLLSTVSLTLLKMKEFSVFTSLIFLKKLMLVFCFILSIIFVYYALIKFGLEPLLVLVVASVLLWTNRGLSFYYIATEPFSASVLNFTIGSMFLALRLNNWKSYLLLCILTFNSRSCNSIVCISFFGNKTI